MAAHQPEDFACPRCHRVDQVRAVHSILAGGFATGVLRSLGAPKAPAPHPGTDAPPRAWHLFSLGLLAWETVCVPIAAITTIDRSPHAGVWVVCSILFGALMILTFLARDTGAARANLPRARQIMAIGRGRLATSLYCSRCRVAYEVA